MMESGQLESNPKNVNTPEDALIKLAHPGAGALLIAREILLSMTWTLHFGRPELSKRAGRNSDGA